MKPDQRPGNYDEEITRLRNEIIIREQKSPPCNDIIKTQPCYFNTGCCRFKDGEITGIELEDGELRLVKWGLTGGELTRTEFESASLTEIFANL